MAECIRRIPVEYDARKTSSRSVVSECVSVRLELDVDAKCQTTGGNGYRTAVTKGDACNHVRRNTGK